MHARLQYANLRYTKLNDAFLYGANLYGAILSHANLCNANLKWTELTDTNLSDANLYNANLEYAYLNNAQLDSNERCRFGTILKDDIIGYKKTLEGKIIELKIPKGAVVFSINKNSCRTNTAIVTKCKGIQHSYFKEFFEYKQNKVLDIEDFNMQYNVQDTTGIHFFRTKEEAKDFIY